MSWIPKKIVVVPIDFSVSSDEAVRTALQLTESPRDVHVVHVAVMPDFVPYGELLWSVEPDRWVDLAQKHMTGFLKSHPEFEGVTSVTLQGDAGTRVSEYAKEKGADLIVMPSHGYHGIKRILLGSVAESVLRHAPCEVLVLRRPQ